MHRLPSLTALRAFEAAARHLSFAEAAKELNVTPAALSFQIRQLETELGAPLFVRLTRAVQLTSAGEAMAPAISEGFAALRTGWSAAHRIHDDKRLVVTAGPGFTAKWLAPQLGRFARENPAVELRVVTTLAMLNFARDGIDLAVRFGEARDDENALFTERLVGEQAFPVMRPDFAARIKTPADLLNETLITDESISFLHGQSYDWRLWLGASGVVVDTVPPGPSFTQADHAVDAALEGAGVALARTSMVQGAMLSGALVAPFDVALGLTAHYRIVCPPGGQDRPAALAFRRFLHDLAADGRDLLAQKTIIPLAG